MTIAEELRRTVERVISSRNEPPKERAVSYKELFMKISAIQSDLLTPQVKKELSVLSANEKLYARNYLKEIGLEKEAQNLFSAREIIFASFRERVLSDRGEDAEMKGIGLAGTRRYL